MGYYVFNLVIVEIEDDERFVCFKGEYCICDFLEWLDIFIEEDICNVIVLVYNF